jgi:hypothetical protein
LLFGPHSVKKVIIFEIRASAARGGVMSEEVAEQAQEKSDLVGKTCFVIMPFGQKREIGVDGQIQAYRFRSSLSDDHQAHRAAFKA